MKAFRGAILWGGLLFSVGICAPSHLQQQDTGATIGFSSAPFNDPRKQVFAGDKIMAYDEALPVLTRMLHGDIIQQGQAVDGLKRYGVSLQGTDALDELIALLERKDDFSVLDRTLEASRKTKILQGSIAETLTEKRLAALLQIKSDAMTAVVMSGSPKASALLKRYRHSPSKMEQAIAEDAIQAQASDGTWKQGMVPTKPQPALYPFRGRSYTRGDYLARVTQALEREDIKDTANAVAFIAKGGSGAIKGSKVFERLVMLFHETAHDEQTPADFRENIVMIIGSSGDARSEAFLQIAANDDNQRIRDLAVSFLESVKRK